ENVLRAVRSKSLPIVRASINVLVANLRVIEVFPKTLCGAVRSSRSAIYISRSGYEISGAAGVDDHELVVGGCLLAVDVALDARRREVPAMCNGRVDISRARIDQRQVGRVSPGWQLEGIRVRDGTCMSDGELSR